jgi:spermidine/putrescine-binding protein
MSDKLSRRNFVKCAGAAAGAAGLAGCAGSSGGGGGLESGERPIKWLAPAWAARSEQVTHFEDATGLSLNVTNANNATTQQKVFTGAAETFDAVSHDTVLGPAFTVDQDKTDSIATEDVERWSDENVADVFTNFEETFSHLGGQTEKMGTFLWEDSDTQEELRHPPHVFNFNGVGLNPKYIDKSNTHRYSALFDDQYEGQVAMGSVPSITMNEVMGHLKDTDRVDARVGQLNNPTEDQIDVAVDYLVKQKESGQFRSTWTAYGQSVNLMSSEEAIIGDLWQPAVLDVRRAGTPCNYATMSEGVQGYQYWWGGVIPLKPGASERNNLNEVTSLYNMHLGAWFPGFIQNWGYPTANYPNKELVRDGEDETGQGMGPEYYDWAYEGKATYDAIDEPALFDPMSYEWSMEEGSPSSEGSVRDQGSIEERINRTSHFQIWPDNSEYLLERWKDFETA